ncbi:hypothetical protein NMY22_g17649 [Coprinellus aureogranulatus]|nr:hypothetical protein NMY22_g17649 [Coprinellus aureogranulatus]
MNAQAHAYHVVPTFIPIENRYIIHHGMHLDHYDALQYLARIEELDAQKLVLEAEKDQLACQNAELTVALDELKAQVDELKSTVRELKKKERLAKKKVTPEYLFKEVLVPMFKLDPTPTRVPETMEIEYRKPCAPTAGHAEIEIRTLNTVTNTVIRERSRAILCVMFLIVLLSLLDQRNTCRTVSVKDSPFVTCPLLARGTFIQHLLDDRSRRLGLAPTPMCGPVDDDETPLNDSLPTLSSLLS